MRIRTAAIATSLTALFSASAGAFAPVPKGESPLETNTAQPARSFRAPVRTVPLAAKAAIDRIAASGLGRVLWDRDTGAATQLYGAGIAVPGANGNAASAESAARAFLAEHLGVLAPGATVADFELITNIERDDLRAVGFAQRAGGIPVVGGQIGFVFKRDRLIIVNSTALPNVPAIAAAAAFQPEAVRSGARGWITSITGAPAKATDISDRAVLPIVHPRSGTGPDIEYRTVYPVQVDLTDGAIGSWEVFVDAATATPVARRTKIRFATGTVVYRVPERYPGGTHANFAASFANHTVNGSPVTATVDGTVTWAGAAPATISPGLVGTRVRMHSNGALATTSLTLTGGGSAVWDETANEGRDAQLTSYIHANVVKTYVKARMAPTLAWINGQLDVFVNESGSCNAYSTGDDIHFFPADSQCENTGRLADVVYHEFGHSLHANAMIPGVGDFDGAVSEGVSDFLAATITDDPGMGRGFFFSNDPLRHLDPTGSELVYPDDLTGESHADGEIIGQTLWDLRKALIVQLGPVEGIALAEKIYYSIIQVSQDLPSTYAAALLADDDDGNLDNGTPHQCTIQQAFGTHGLADSSAQSLGIGLPTADNLVVTIPIAAPPAGGLCPPPTVSAATLQWAVRGEGTVMSIDMVETDVGGGATQWQGTIPPQANDTVVKYKITLDLSDGNQLAYPDNRADQYYELYVGPVEEIWCDDFEDGAVDWTTGATPATNDEWEAGPPTGLGDDPTAAYEGLSVFGTDLTINGLYRRDTETFARTPVIDVTGKEGVRLQYRRWLGVEDGFFDQAQIIVDGMPRWSNLDSMQGNSSDVTHADKEWRFQDVDLAADAADGSVQVEFRLTSDAGLQFGGWTLDRVCVVARLPGGVCGDGNIDPSEQCDDLNTVDGDGCSASCQDEIPGDDMPGPDGGCCSTGSGPGGPIVLGLLTLGIVVRRRRRLAR